MKRVGTKGRREGSEVYIDGDSHQQPDRSVLHYWAVRLRPTWARDDDTDQVERSEHQTDLNEPNDLRVVLCNRFGHEGGAMSVPFSRRVC